MSRIIYYYIIATLVMMSTVMALESPSEIRSRFSGRIEAGGFYANSNSQIIAYEVSGIDKRIENLGKSESTLSFGSPLLLFDVNYEVSDDVLVYFGTPFFMDSREGLSLGAELLLNNNSVIDVSIFGDSSGVWKDPYLTGTNREVTYSHKGGVNIMFTDIMGTSFHLNYVASIHTVEDDVSGETDERLKREGFTEKYKPGYTFVLSQDYNTALTSSLIYERNNSEGRAYTYNKAGLEISLAYENKQNTLVLSAESAKALYSNPNPKFNKKVRNKTHSGSFIYTRTNLWETDWYLRIGGGLDYLDSNTNFFDHTIYITGLTIGYSFE